MKTKHIYLVWFIALLPTMLLRDFTLMNELRYLSIVDEALRNGNIFTFTNQGVIYTDKPPLYFWLMMLGKALLGGHRMWFLSLLSFIPALVTLITMTKWIRKENGVNERFPLLMLMTGGFFLVFTVYIRMDMLMVMFITLSLYTFYKIYKQEHRKRDLYLFPLYVFLALFSKGPVGILVPVVSTLLFLLYKRQLNTIQRYWGWKSLLIILTGCVIWFTGVYIEGGKEYLYDLVVHQTVDRGINAFHHKEPFYFYAMTIWYALAPWSLLVIGLIIAGWLKEKIDTDIERFFAIIVVSIFVMLSVFSSKQDYYLLSIIPFAIYLSMLLLNKFDVQNTWIKLSIAIPAVIFISAPVVIFYLSRMEEAAFLGMPSIFVVAAIVSISGLIVIYRLYRKNNVYRSLCVMSIGILSMTFVLGCSMPRLNPYIGVADLCKHAKTLAEENRISNYCVYGIHRAENMDVFLGEDVKMVEKEDIVGDSLTNAIVMLPVKKIKKDEELHSAIKNKTYLEIGNHAIVIF